MTRSKPILNKPNIKRIIDDVEAIDSITRRLEAGESQSALAKSYGVSRDELRSLFAHLGIFPKEIKASGHEKLVRRANAMILSGEADSVKDAAGQLGVTAHLLRQVALQGGLDLDQAKQERKKHRLDGQRFGMWSVIPGTYRRRLNQEGSKNRPYLVDCKCDCGTERTVSVRNLQSGTSQGCGCRSKKDGIEQRKVVPWICLESDQRISNTSALAKLYDINYQTLFRVFKCSGKFLAPDGTTWVALFEEAKDFEGESFKAPTPWTCLSTGKNWPSAVALAEQLGVSSNNLYDCIRAGRTYCGADRQHYTPVGMEDLRPSRYRARPHRADKVTVRSGRQSAAGGPSRRA